MTATHSCAYTWCRSPGGAAGEHIGKGHVATAAAEVHCYAWVSTEDDYDDEIHLGIRLPAVDDEVSVFLTDDQARELIQLIDTALANRAEIRAA